MSTLVLEYDELLVSSSVHVHAEPPSMLAPHSSTESSVLSEVYVEESSREQIPADSCRSLQIRGGEPGGSVMASCVGDVQQP